jgi:hypothetical protein
VIDLGAYSLFPDYAALFTPANERSAEVIFSVTYERGQNEGSSIAAYWTDPIPFEIPLPNLANAFYCIDGLAPAVSPLYNAAHQSENRDPRFKATLVANGDTWKGATQSGNATYFWRKWTEESNNLDHFDSPQDFYVIRYAHVLLMRAEALVKTGSYDETEVIDLINEVRDRVDMPAVEDVEGTGLSAAALLEIIKHEIRVETAFEGLRYFDQKRWGELFEGYEYFNDNEFNQYGNEMLERSTDPKLLIWPLPQGELDVNKALRQHEIWGG